MLPPILSRMKSLGYKVFDDPKLDYDLNIIGIRNSDGEANAFDDLIGMFYLWDGSWRGHFWNATVDPGHYWLEKPSNIKGTAVGQDTKTQITTIVTGEKIKLSRVVGSSAAINIDSGNSYTVVLEQDGVVNEVKVNGGSASTIVIRQSSG